MVQNSISIRLKNQLYPLSNPVVMGILNVTPDSFYSKSRIQSEEEILARCEAILSEGGAIIDLGGYSTRPTAVAVSESEEQERLFWALEIIKKQFPEAILSVDTFRAAIAEAVIKDFGVDIINDVSGGTLDANMFNVIAKYNVPYILMHMRGTPQTMQSLTEYDNFMEDIMRFFAEKIRTLTAMGVSDIILDPGFGFAKTIEQNFELLRDLSNFRIFDRPVLAGLSRKSMLYKSLNTDAEHSLTATIAANTLALAGGASILRVHDVKEAVETIDIFMHTYPRTE
ncbi:dihydropteroate synthase [Paludibacter jiangxiensis]|uniref:dihydropteroate synthase n=2 Tax=Paludibacter jiangxiensis TaxID=681398 RepID=A0A170Y2K4_9BACT|nr:dihydropteroate synthase [Paludibacter jiangxiensis]GAT61460.1 dihydropteroate synthase [Paludibacter jiangxiensis]